MHPKSRFPHPTKANEEGLLAVGGDMLPETLIDAYLHGIFPWPMGDEYPLAWFSPDPRGIIRSTELHVPRSLQKLLEKKIYSITYNQAFGKIIHLCAETRKNNTWISAEIIEGYTQLFHLKLAYSVEVWKEEKIVGGMYGVCLGNYYSGESMFHLEDNTSKIAVVSLMKKLQTQNIAWLDTQMTTSVVSSLGGKLIPRELFLSELEKFRFDRPRELVLGS